MSRDEHIASVGNTVVPAFLALTKDGFEVAICSRDPELWEAKKAGPRLVGDSPLELLALWALRSKRGTDWKATDEEIDGFLAAFYPERTNENG